jgi:hypothetical protein
MTDLHALLAGAIAIERAGRARWSGRLPIPIGSHAASQLGTWAG